MEAIKIESIEALASTKLEKCLLWAAETFGSNDPEDYRFRDGFLLFDPPTGEGKTFASIKAAVNILEHTNRMILMLTPRNNVLDKIYGDVVKEIESRGKGSLLEEVLLVRRNIEGILDELPGVLRADEIPDGIKNLPEWGAFIELFSLVLRKIQDSGNKRSRREEISKHEDELNQAEQSFRKALKRHLRGIFPEASERRNAIFGSEYSWITALWKATQIRNKRLIIMNVDKFLSPIDTMTSRIDAIHDGLFNDSVIFLDEIDQAREHMLNRIIEKANNSPYDIFHVCKRICKELIRLEFEDLPPELATMSKKGKELGHMSLKKRFDDVKGKAVGVFNDFDLKYNIKKSENVKATRNFLFQERGLHSVVNGKPGIIFSTTYHDKRTQYLEDERSDHSRTLGEVTAQAESAIRSFVSLVYTFSANYTQLQYERGRREYRLPEAVATILDHFGFNIDEGARRYLFDATISMRSRESHKREGHQDGDLVEGNISSFDLGLRLFDIEDANHHDVRSVVNTYQVDGSPEQMICDLAEHTLVIGLSATARFGSTLNNFNEGYVRGRLGEKFRKFPDYLRAEIKAHHDFTTAGYGKVIINVGIIECLLPAKVELKNIFKKWGAEDPDALVKEEFINPLRIELPESKHDSIAFYLKRYVNISKAADEFFSRKSIRSFLFFTMALPKENAFYDTELLELIVDTCRSYYNYEGQDEYLYIIRGGKAFEIFMNKFKAAASAGHKVFGVTSYASAGTGINADYTIPEDSDIPLIWINDFRDGLEKETKDVDGVFLDLPTHMVPFFEFQPLTSVRAQIGDALRALLQGLWHTEAGEISRQEYSKFVLGILTHIATGRRAYANPIRHTQSFHFAVLREIYQALGRMCRSSLKSPELLILIASDAVFSFAFVDDLGPDFVFTREFEALIKGVAKHELAQRKETSRPDKYRNKAAEKNRSAWNEVQRILGVLRKDPSMANRWEDLREFTLRHPTFKDVNNRYSHDIYDRYIELPELNDFYTYSYPDPNKTQNATVNFNKTGKYEVSANKARLEAFMKIPGLRSHFHQNGFATDWAPGSFILPPVLFKEVYLGALGEVALKHLLLQELGVNLKPMPQDKTEIFDFLAEVEGKKTYLDAKNWRHDMKLTFEEQIDHVRMKMRINSFGRAVIINIMDQAPETLMHDDRNTVEEGEIFIVHALCDFNGSLDKEAFKFIHKILWHEV